MFAKTLKGSQFWQFRLHHEKLQMPTAWVLSVQKWQLITLETFFWACKLQAVTTLINLMVFKIHFFRLCSENRVKAFTWPLQLDVTIFVNETLTLLTVVPACSLRWQIFQNDILIYKTSSNLACSKLYEFQVRFPTGSISC